MKHSKATILSIGVSMVMVSILFAQKEPMVIQDQGSFAIGGSVIENPGTFDAIKRTPKGQTFHGDHAYIFYQIPVDARKYPLVMWHGFGQFSKTW